MEAPTASLLTGRSPEGRTDGAIRLHSRTRTRWTARGTAAMAAVSLGPSIVTSLGVSCLLYLDQNYLSGITKRKPAFAALEPVLREAVDRGAVAVAESAVHER